jgi:hypothetical protein
MKKDIKAEEEIYLGVEKGPVRGEKGTREGDGGMKMIEVCGMKMS